MESGRMSVVLEDISGFACKYTLLPKEEEVFNMFRMMSPHQVKVVLVGQSPYPGSCPVTRVPYACGPAFLPAPGCVTTPATLKNILVELCRDFSVRTQKTPRDILVDWISQGVMLLNSSFTLGTHCPEYLEDHSLVWEEVMQEILEKMSVSLNSVVFVLIGKDAWKFESCIMSNNIIKVSHPVARKETTTPWYGSGVFSKISNMMVDMDVVPIKWI